MLRSAVSDVKTRRISACGCGIDINNCGCDIDQSRSYVIKLKYDHVIKSGERSICEVAGLPASAGSGWRRRPHLSQMKARRV